MNLLHVQIIHHIDQQSLTLWSPSGTGLRLQWRQTELNLKDIGIREVIEVDDVE